MSHESHAPRNVRHDLKVASIPPCADECGDFVRRILAEKGVEAHVTYLPPIVAPIYEPLDMRCPHGVVWYAEPTSEQIARWSKAGVR